MNKYVIGIVVIMLFVGVVAAIIAHNHARHANLEEKLFAALESRSDPYPKDLEAIVPRYPNSRGLHVTTNKENTLITADTQDSLEKVEEFYLKELESRGWISEELEEKDKGKNIYLFSQNEHKLMLFFSKNVILNSQYTTYFIDVTDKSKGFKPKKENASSAAAIIETMVNTYQNCLSYRGKGTETTHFLEFNGEPKWTSVNVFKTAFIRPGLLRYEIVGTDDSWGEKKIIYSDSTGVYEWTGSLHPVESLSMAFASADPMLMPELVTNTKETWLLRLHELGVPVEEDVDENICLRIDGKDSGGGTVSLWIDKQSNLLNKMEHNAIFDDFQTKSVSIFNNEINVEISEKELALRPFGAIPVPVGQVIKDINRFWHYSGPTIKLLYISAALLFIAGILCVVCAIRRWRRNKLTNINQSPE